MPVHDPVAHPGTTRERILRAAARLFAEHGYHGASMRDIAQASGLRAASLYNHFPGKEDLFLGIGERYFGAMLPMLHSIAKRKDDPLTRIADMISGSIEIGLSHRDEHLTLSSDMRLVRKTPRLSSLLDAGRECTRQWGHVIDEGRRAGVIRTDIQPGDVIWLVFTSITGTVDDGYRVDVLGNPTSGRTSALRAVLVDGLRAAESIA